MKGRYPKPKEVGGKLIRRVVGLLKEFEAFPSVGSHILIACSGGPDSLAAAHLLVHYGRRVGARERIRLVHFDHGWSAGSAEVARRVERLGREWGVPVVRGQGSAPKDGESWEAEARDQRNAFFSRLLGENPGVLITAHHADDLAETVLWRLFSGAGESHGGGIEVRSREGFLRPLLRVRKHELREYCREEGLEFHEDPFNTDPRFLRVRVRQELLPAIEASFPRAVDHLVSAALEAQFRSGGEPATTGKGGSGARAPVWLLGMSGTRLRRAHLEALSQAAGSAPGWSMDLPEGWRLHRLGTSEGVEERWVLEKCRVP